MKMHVQPRVKNGQRISSTFVRFDARVRSRTILGVAAFFALILPSMLFGQQAQPHSPLTLRQAVNFALEKNPQRKAALAETRAASAGVMQAKSVLYPHVMFSETA